MSLLSRTVVSKELSKLLVFLCDKMTLPEGISRLCVLGGDRRQSKKMEDRAGFRINVINIGGVAVHNQ